MPGRRIRLTLVGAVIAVSVPLLSAGPAVAAPLPPAALRTLPGCDGNEQPPRPSTVVPWAQKRYSPERLAPLATGRGVTVAVMDSGVDKTNPQLRGRVEVGRDYLVPGLDGSRDCVGHGTGVASIIAAKPTDGMGLRGLAPDVDILPVRVSERRQVDGEERGETATPAEFAAAIGWAVQNGADVINLSVTFHRDDPLIRAAIASALENDVVVVAAAGNDFDKGNPRPYPAAYDGVIGVGSIGEDGQISPFSQRGDWVDLVAPGGNVIVATPERGHKIDNGTSFAAPYVAATAALVREYLPNLTAKQVAERLVATADPAGGDRDTFGAGVLNPYRAVTDTPPPAARQVAAGLPPHRDDPAEVARAQRRSLAQERALWVAGLAGTVAGLALLLAVVVPRGIRRGWRPADPAHPADPTASADPA